MSSSSFPSLATWMSALTASSGDAKVRCSGTGDATWHASVATRAAAHTRPAEARHEFERECSSAAPSSPAARAAAAALTPRAGGALGLAARVTRKMRPNRCRCAGARPCRRRCCSRAIRDFRRRCCGPGMPSRLSAPGAARAAPGPRGSPAAPSAAAARSADVRYAAAERWTRGRRAHRRCLPGDRRPRRACPRGGPASLRASPRESLHNRPMRRCTCSRRRASRTDRSSSRCPWRRRARCRP